MAPFLYLKLICYLFRLLRRRLLADRFLRMFQMVANCELRRTGTQTSDAAGIVWKLRGLFAKYIEIRRGVHGRWSALRA